MDTHVQVLTIEMTVKARFSTFHWLIYPRHVLVRAMRVLIRKTACMALAPGFLRLPKSRLSIRLLYLALEPVPEI